MFGLIIAKFYLRQVENDRKDSIWNTCQYSFFLIYPLFFGLILIIFRLFERLHLIDPDNRLPEVLTHLVACILFIIIFYFYFVKYGYLERTVNKYADYGINNSLLNFLFFALPFMTFLIGPTITVLFFGGSIMTHDYVGILAPYLPPK